jgi:hypothetical protein
MIRQWIQIVLLAILMFIQMACSQHAMRQHDDVRAQPLNTYGSSQSG